MGLVGGPAGIRQEVLDGLAGALGDVLKRRQGGPGPASLDQVDRRSGDVALAELGQAELCFRPGLFDRALPEVDPRETPPPCCAGCTRWIRHPPHPAFAGIDHGGHASSNRLTMEG